MLTGEQEDFENQKINGAEPERGKARAPAGARDQGLRGQILLPHKLSPLAPVPGCWALLAVCKDETRGPVQTFSPKGQVRGHQTGPVA